MPIADQPVGPPSYRNVLDPLERVLSRASRSIASKVHHQRIPGIVPGVGGHIAAWAAVNRAISADLGYWWAIARAAYPSRER
jgi:hypothetical protein